MSASLDRDGALDGGGGDALSRAKQTHPDVAVDATVEGTLPSAK